MVFNYEDLVYTKGSRRMPWNPKSSMNVYYYLVDGLLIDTGPANLADIAIPFFESNDIKQVVLTHIHEDHAGMASWLQENMQVPVYLHPDSIAEALKEPQLSNYRLDIWGRRRAFTAVPLAEALKSDKYVFDIIDSPGHCRHHKAVLLEEKGWLFSGDLVTVLRPTAVFQDENLSEMILSLQHMLNLPFETVFCAHTGIHQHGKDLFRQKLDYLLKLQKRIRTLRADGLNDIEITRHLFPSHTSLNSIIAQDFSALYIIATL